MGENGGNEIGAYKKDNEIASSYIGSEGNSKSSNGFAGKAMFGAAGSVLSGVTFGTTKLLLIVSENLRARMVAIVPVAVKVATLVQMMITLVLLIMSN